MSNPNERGVEAASIVTFNGEPVTYQGEPLTYSDGEILTFSDGEPLTFSNGDRLRFGAKDPDYAEELKAAASAGLRVLLSPITGEPLRSAIDGSLLTSPIDQPPSLDMSADLNRRLGSLSAQLDRVEIIVGELIDARVSQYRGGIGHNNPPEGIDEAAYPTAEELRSVQLSISDVRSELGKAATNAAPNVAVLIRAQGQLEWLTNKLKWLAGKLLTGGVTTVGGLAMKKVIEHPGTIELLHTTSSIIGDWAHLLNS